VRTLERVCIYLFKFAGLPKLREILLRKSNGEIDGSNAKNRKWLPRKSSSSQFTTEVEKKTPPYHQVTWGQFNLHGLLAQISAT